MWYWLLYRKLHGLKKNYMRLNLAKQSVSNKASTILPIMEGKTF